MFKQLWPSDIAYVLAGFLKSLYASTWLENLVGFTHVHPSQTCSVWDEAVILASWALSSLSWGDKSWKSMKSMKSMFNFQSLWSLNSLWSLVTLVMFCVVLCYFWVSWSQNPEYTCTSYKRYTPCNHGAVSCLPRSLDEFIFQSLRQNG